MTGAVGMEQYSMGKLLNKGAFGAAHMVRCKKTDKDFVVKLVDISKCSSKERESAHKECGILEALRHPNIIEHRESFEQDGQLCIVMAFADGGDLTGRIKAQRGKLFSEEQVLDWFCQLSLALKHVHDRKILHRDLKAQNIFLSNGGSIIKLGDFGIARVLTSGWKLA
ncbi:kinase-like domain-containing protein [Baffinella frigidus]|nr:kinase-like domain-containing protein [Cryptophyta sp. CCMP2293]